MMGNKTKIAKCPLKIKQPKNSLKSTQDTFIGSEKPLQKKTVGLETSQARGEKSRMAVSPTQDLRKPCTDDDCCLNRREISPAASNMQKTRNTGTSLGAKQKPCKKHIIAEHVNSSLVCLTQEQLRQILMTVNQGKGSISLTESEKEEETSQDRLHLNSILNQPKKENTIGLLKETDAVSSVPNENKSVVNKNRETSTRYEQKVIVGNEWKPADIFTTLGERERDRSLLEAKKAQWRKELDEQVALKKKEKEASEKQNNSWEKSENDKITWDNLQILDRSMTSAGSSDVLSQSPCQVIVAQADGPSLHKASQILEGEERDRWAMQYDSLKSHPGSQSQLCSQSQSTHKQPEYFCVSPDTQERADVGIVYTPIPGSQLEPSEEEQVAKPVRDMAVANHQKTNFLRSMTALLDPAQIEERDRRRQKQLEHQKAITAQVEEKRRRKQLEEQQRKKEEQEEERRLAREQEEMQKQYEEDILKQKRKEEIMTLKTNELFQTVQKAQEQAQRLRQEQRIRELANKGHDTSRLVKNLGVDKIHVEYNASTNISNSRSDFDEAGGKINTSINSMTSPKKDTGVQTDDLNTGILTTAEPHCGPITEREVINCSSPEISAEFSGQFNKDKQELSENKGANLEKENSWYDQCNHLMRTEKKQIKHTKKCPKRPDWNINKPLKRYVPASEKYPKQLQKQREEKKVRRQMELLHLVERNNPEHLCQNRGTSPVLPSSHEEMESKIEWHLFKKEEPPLKIHSFSKERFQSSPVPPMKSRTQQTQTTALHLPLKNSSYESENLMLGGSQTELSAGMPELPHFIPYIRTNEIYYLDPDAPLSRSSIEDPQYQNNSCDCDQEQQLFNSDQVRDPLLNPNLLKNRDRQQAILKGLSELRQGLLQKQKELETNLMPLAANQEKNFSSSFII
ncbi:PREDICTED: coiled-coil domain-containing protein 66 isoform X2 [Chinchilla lanigera]|uniref:coiled-coil domain-containing protein 66 isoform X2 n=1 Tax=Chinchilla lanigera TaxID=34839 RepID=UPI00038EBDDC|nr:PREDICTED: coiled-coil domain-containing protein 66 isoform X2 [Chinchilla lanigera]